MPIFIDLLKLAGHRLAVLREQHGICGAWLVLQEVLGEFVAATVIGSNHEMLLRMRRPA